VDTVPATLVSINTTSTSTSITVNWVTNKPTTAELFWGVSPNHSNVVPDNGVYATSHSVKITGLSSNTVYAVQPAGVDQAGTAFLGGVYTARTGN
jgi:hypothetical protein